MKSELIFLFTIPTVKTNIGRSFTKEELECITNIPTTKGERVIKTEKEEVREKRIKGLSIHGLTHI